MYNDKPIIKHTVWTFKDLLIVTLIIVIISLLLYITTLILFGDNKWNFTLSRYVASILMIISPIFLLKIKYGLSKEVIGLTVCNNKLIKFIIIGIVISISYSFIYYYIFLKPNPNFYTLKDNYSYFNLLMLPISIVGFVSIVLAPIGEEIMIRGYIYGYLKNKFGSVIGNILQAFIFAFLHYNIFRVNIIAVCMSFVVGLLMGFLYEKSGSLYPSMISHGIINYLVIIATVVNR